MPITVCINTAPHKNKYRTPDLARCDHNKQEDIAADAITDIWGYIIWTQPPYLGTCGWLKRPICSPRVGSISIIAAVVWMEIVTYICKSSKLPTKGRPWNISWEYTTHAFVCSIRARASARRLLSALSVAFKSRCLEEAQVHSSHNVDAVGFKCKRAYWGFLCGMCAFGRVRYIPSARHHSHGYLNTRWPWRACTAIMSSFMVPDKNQMWNLGYEHSRIRCLPRLNDENHTIFRLNVHPRVTCTGSKSVKYRLRSIGGFSQCHALAHF